MAMIVSVHLFAVLSLIGWLMGSAVFYGLARWIAKTLDEMELRGIAFCSAPSLGTGFACYLAMAGVGICLVKGLELLQSLLGGL